MLTAIIVAAGSSQRMGFDKVFAMLGDKPVVAHTLDAFERTESVTKIILVGREDRRLPRTIHDRLPAGGALLGAEKPLLPGKSRPVSALLRRAGFRDITGRLTGTPLDAVLAVK